jgi:chromosome partitioning protein
MDRRYFDPALRQFGCAMNEEIVIGETATTQPTPDPEPHGIVVGNEKGGTGKSTVAMHLVVALLRLGFKVGSIDLDARQGTLTHYLANRDAFRQNGGPALRMPVHRRVERSRASEMSASVQDEQERFDEAWRSLSGCKYIVIDSPGSDSSLARIGHTKADTLVTPINDSYLDVDVLARIDVDKREAQAPSIYTQMVWEQNNRRVLMGRPPIDWVVMRNRLSHIDAHNKRDITALLDKLSQRIGFRIAAGFGERVVFRDLFLRGLTLMDLAEIGELARINSPSQDAARRELTGLLETIGILTPQASEGE